MANFYSDLADEVTAAIAEFGQPVLFELEELGEYDPLTGHAGSTIAQYTHNACLFEYKQGISDIEGVTVKRDDKKLLFAPPLEFTPTTAYTVTIGGIKYSIVNLQVTSPAGIPVLYEAQLRR